MQTTSRLQPLNHPRLPVLEKYWRNSSRFWILSESTSLRLPSSQQRAPRSRVFALKRDQHGNDHYKSRLVDDNMIFLRKRIHEMRLVERSDEAPLHWMEWEKRWYPSYDSDVCELVGYLQNVLMETRPSLALGILVVLMLSVCISFAWVLLHVICFLH